MTAIVGDCEEAVRSQSQDGIDPELAAFAARFARQLQKLTRILERLGRLAEAGQALQAEANPVSPEVELLLLLLSGSPAADDPRVRDGRRRLEAKMEGLREKIDAWQAEAGRLDADETALRSRLAARHGLTLPPLSPPKDAASKTYSDEELTSFRKACAGKTGVWGRMQLKETHPTGEFNSSALDSVKLTDDREGIILVIRCRWEGGLTGAAYVTLFRAVIDKRKGLLELSVPQDTAVILIAAPNLLVAQARFRDEIRMLSQ